MAENRIDRRDFMKSTVAGFAGFFFLAPNAQPDRIIMPTNTSNAKEC
jgi:hypothetical protein